ncbi:molybdate ABC transporter substrate-binding protein [Octadecabacter sp.]|nr:molybdate ABC transporter substrate-binding protein [Octadecabacter sp.]
MCVAFASSLSVQALHAEGVTVFVAASLREATEALSAQYHAQSGDQPVLVFASTSAVARQVSQGAPADVALLADQEWADWLVRQGGVSEIAPFAGNRLVLVSGGSQNLERISDLTDALGSGVLAMAQPDAVPAGRYGKAALVHSGLWEDLSPQIVQAANVRAALRFVERGEAPFGIGYASDLVALPGLHEVYSFAPDSHPPIVYVAAQATPEGADFMTFLQSDTAQEILQTWGFSPAPDQP